MPDISLVDSETSSNLCGVLYAPFSRSLDDKLALAKSVTVSVNAQKLGGDDTHPIGLVNGMPTNAGSFSRDGKRTANQMVSPGAIHSR